MVMLKQIALVILLVAVVSSPPSASPAPIARPAVQFSPQCLHGASELPSDQFRREQALRLAQEINRAEGGGPTVLPGQARTNPYQPLDRLQNLPPTPSGFKLQLNVDDDSYAFSLKDTLDACHFAIFSDQDARIYQALPTLRGAEIRPADIP
jgi:hypothetical protein